MLPSILPPRAARRSQSGGREAVRSLRLKFFAVVRCQGQRAEVDAVETADVDRDHLARARRGAAGEGLDPAFAAELMVNDLLVEIMISYLMLIHVMTECTISN